MRAGRATHGYRARSVGRVDIQSLWQLDGARLPSMVCGSRDARATYQFQGVDIWVIVTVTVDYYQTAVKHVIERPTSVRCLIAKERPVVDERDQNMNHKCATTNDVDGAHISHNTQHCEHVLVLEFRPHRDFVLKSLQ